MFEYIIRSLRRQPVRIKELQGEGIDELSAHYHAKHRMQAWIKSEEKDGNRIEILKTNYSYIRKSELLTRCELSIEYRAFRKHKK